MNNLRQSQSHVPLLGLKQKHIRITFICLKKTKILITLSYWQKYTLLSARQCPIAEDNIYTTHCTCNSWNPTYKKPTPLHSSILGTERYSEWYQRRRGNINWATNSLIYHVALPARYTRGTKLVWETNQYLIWPESHSTKLNSYAVSVALFRSPDNSETYDKTKYCYSKTKQK